MNDADLETDYFDELAERDSVGAPYITFDEFKASQRRRESEAALAVTSEECPF